jgi:hypothetical protein
MNIRRETTFLSGVKDGNENKSGYGLTGKRGKGGYEGIKKVLKKPKISLPMSLVFAEEKCLQVLLDFLFYTDDDRISRVVEEAENSDHAESSDGGV